MLVSKLVIEDERTTRIVKPYNKEIDAIWVLPKLRNLLKSKEIKAKIYAKN